MTTKTLGKKQICPKCGAKFYDLGAKKIICPKCSHKIIATAVKKAPALAVKRAIKKVVVKHEAEDELPSSAHATNVEALEKLEDDDGADVISLNEVEEHTEEAETDPNGDDAEDEMYLDNESLGGSSLLDDVNDYIETDKDAEDAEEDEEAADEKNIEED
jgi:uncharacterized protein (TIGR02300 family)